jgi:hypothetical protein
MLARKKKVEKVVIGNGQNDTEMLEEKGAKKLWFSSSACGDSSAKPCVVSLVKPKILKNFIGCITIQEFYANDRRHSFFIQYRN